MNLKKILILWGIALIYCTIPSLTYAQSMQLTIADSIRLALQHSPAIKAAEAETGKAGWLLTENRVHYLPKLSANHVQTQNHPGTADSAANSRSSSIDATTTLYSGGLNEGLPRKPKNSMQVQNIN